MSNLCANCKNEMTNAVMALCLDCQRKGIIKSHYDGMLKDAKPLTDLQIATELFLALITGEGGKTVDRFGAVPTEGYVVGVEGIQNPETVDEVAKWVGTFVGTPYYFGVWRDSESNIDFFDAVEVHSDLQEALRAAHLRGEIAIWDLANAEEIRVEYV